MTIDRPEAERLYINAVLHDNLVLASCQLTAPMFTKYRRVWERIETLAAGGPVSLSELFVGGADLDRELLATLDPFTAAGWEFHHKAIFTAWATDQIGNTARVAMTQQYPENVETLEKGLTDVALLESGDGAKTMADLLFPAVQRIIDLQKSGAKLPGLSFGLHGVDTATLGARKGQLIIIGARPGDGKSSLKRQIAVHMAKSVKVGMFTIESTEDEEMDDILAHASGVDSRKLKSGAGLTVTDVANINEAAARLAKIQNNLTIYYKPGITMSRLRSQARKMVREGARILFVDYVQIVRFPGAKDRTAAATEVVTGLKELAGELGIPIVALAQTKRPEGHERRPTMADFQHTSQIEQDADQCWIIWHKESTVAGAPKESKLCLVKVRGGQVCDVPVTFNGPVMTFYEIEEGRE